jgi:hypothetical protein
MCKTSHELANACQIRVRAGWNLVVGLSSRKLQGSGSGAASEAGAWRGHLVGCKRWMVYDVIDAVNLPSNLESFSMQRD